MAASIKVGVGCGALEASVMEKVGVMVAMRKTVGELVGTGESRAVGVGVTELVGAGVNV